MPALRDLQVAFAEAMFSLDVPETLWAGLDLRDPAKARAGLAAYRRSVLANRAAAVKASYPVIGAIVGPEFMDAVCRHYAQTYPSRSGDLNLYGDQLASFLSDFSPAQNLPYLPDVARLEWSVQSVANAADAPAQDLSQLAQIPAEDWGQLSFLVNPAHALVSSPWPVVEIWKVNQDGYASEFAINFDQAQTALVYRRAGMTHVKPISHAQATLLNALSDGATLDQAVAAASSTEEAFDLSETLSHFIADGLLRQLR